MIKIFILFLIFLYIILFLRKLDYLDRKSLYYLIKNINKINLSTSNSTYLKFLLKIFKIPFMEKIYVEKITEGGIYSSYIFNKYPKLSHLMNDKIYWAEIFKKFDINHPKIFLYKNNNKEIFLNQTDDNTEYIYKPINGALGYNVKVISGRNINQILTQSNNFLIQEKLFDCFYGKARYFRCITLYNGEKYLLKLLKNINNNIASNVSNGGISTKCKNFKCNDLSEIEQTNLNNFIIKLQNLHKKLYNKIISIGWDIMIHCENNSIKCYCLEGNICCTVWPENIKDNNVIYKYKKIVKKFYKENNI